MEPEIPDGSRAVFDRRETWSQGDIVVVWFRTEILKPTSPHQCQKYTVAESTARLIRWVPKKMAAQVELADRGRFELPIDAGFKLRPYRD